MRGDNDIFAAKLPVPYRILGLRLRPFSLGHYIHLRRQGCAFVSDSVTNATPTDLVMACLVCSMSFEEFETLIFSERLSFKEKLASFFRALFLIESPMEFIAAVKSSPLQYKVLKWSRKIGHFDFQKKAQLFEKYLSEGTVRPKYWVEKESPHESGAHWSQTVFITLTGNLGFSQTEALNMGLREALLHFFKSSEELGSVRLMTESEIEETEAACG